jgi:hypothetical protein
MNSKNKNIRDLCRGINKLNRGYQPRCNLVKGENGDLLADYIILNRWKGYFSQLLNSHNISGVSQIEIYTAGPLASGPNYLEVEIVIERMEN